MISLRRANQGGSVLTFIIIAVVLAIALIGTAYFVKQKGEQVHLDQATTQADEIAREEDSVPADESNDDEPVASETPAPNSETPAPSPTSEPNEQEVLPTTGPENDSINILAVALLTASCVAYITSRRHAGASL